jgi:hypothetical protein
MALQEAKRIDQCKIQKQRSIRSIARQLQRPESSSYEAFTANFKPARKSEGRTLRRAVSSIYSTEDIWEERSPVSASSRRRSESFDNVFASFADDVDSWSELGSLPSLTRIGDRRTIDPEAAAALHTWEDQLLADYDEDSVSETDSNTDRVWTPLHNGSAEFTTPEKGDKDIQVPQITLPEDEHLQIKVPQVALPDAEELEIKVQVPKVLVEEEFHVQDTEDLPDKSQDIFSHFPDLIELPRSDRADPQARFSAIVHPVKPHVPLEAEGPKLKEKKKKKKQKKTKKASNAPKTVDKAAVTAIAAGDAGIAPNGKQQAAVQGMVGAIHANLLIEPADPRGASMITSEVTATKDEARNLLEPAIGAKPKQSKLGLLDRIDVLLFGELPPIKSPMVDSTQVRERDLEVERPRLKVELASSAITNQRFVLQQVPHGAHRRPQRPRRSPPPGANVNKDLPPPPSPTSARRRTQNPGLGIHMQSRVEPFDLSVMDGRAAQQGGRSAAFSEWPGSDRLRHDSENYRSDHPPVNTRSRANSRARRPRRKSEDTAKAQREVRARQDVMLRPAVTFPLPENRADGTQHDQTLGVGNARDTATIWLQATDELNGNSNWV